MKPFLRASLLCGSALLFGSSACLPILARLKGLRFMFWTRRHDASERALHSPTVSCTLTVGLQLKRESQVVNGVGKKRDSDVLQASDGFVCEFLRFSADRDRGNCGNWSITR